MEIGGSSWSQDGVAIGRLEGSEVGEAERALLVRMWEHL